MDDFTEITNCLDCTMSERCFSQLIPHEKDFINRNKTQIVYSKGEIICKEKAYASHVLFIVDGLVKLYLESPGSRKVNLYVLKTSEYIGLSSVYGENIYQSSAAALVDTTICMISKESFKRILADNGSYATDIIHWSFNLEKELFKRIRGLAHKQMHGRLADILLYLCSNKFDQEMLFDHLSRKDIGEFASISAENTVRLLKELSNDGIIELNGKIIEIIDHNRLTEISRKG
jgi:CRP/FNR family transcriptional regulator